MNCAEKIDLILNSKEAKRQREAKENFAWFMSFLKEQYSNCKIPKAILSVTNGISNILICDKEKAEENFRNTYGLVRNLGNFNTNYSYDSSLSY